MPADMKNLIAHTALEILESKKVRELTVSDMQHHTPDIILCYREIEKLKKQFIMGNVLSSVPETLYCND